MLQYIFLHQYKTGGQTLANIFKFQYGNRYYRIGKFTLQDFLDLNNREKNQLKMVFGHMKFGIHRYLNHETAYLTLLREPVSRIISLYNFINQNENNDLHKTIPAKERKDIYAFIENIDKYTAYHGNNGMTRYLAGCDVMFPENNEWDATIKNVNNYDDILKQAIENFNKYFILAGTTDRFDESIILMKKYLQLKKPLFYLKRNTTHKKDTLSEGVIERIKGKNNMDIKLYNYINKQLFNEISNNQNYIEREKRKLEFNNKLYSLYRQHIRQFIK